MLGRIRTFFNKLLGKVEDTNIYYTPYQIDEEGNELYPPEEKPKKVRKPRGPKKIKKAPSKTTKRGRPKKALK